MVLVNVLYKIKNLALDIQKLKFPIGEFTSLENYSKENLDSYIKDIEELPAQLREEVENLSDEKLDTPYRPDGWTVRQVVHHLPDSHMNAFIRFKLTLTEDNPTIRPYFEDRWANLPDAKMPIDVSLHIIDSIHKRWVYLLKAMSGEDFERQYTHPEYKKVFTLKEALHMYSWHCKHHSAHVQLVTRS